MVKVKVVLILLSVQINILHGVLPLQPWPPVIVVAPFPQVSSRPSPAMLYYQSRDHSVFLPVRGQQRFFSPVSTQNFSRLVTKHFTFSDVQQRIKRFAQIYQLPVSPCALSHTIRWPEMGPRNVQTVVFWWFKAEPLLDLRVRHKKSIKVILGHRPTVEPRRKHHCTLYILITKYVPIQISSLNRVQFLNCSTFLIKITKEILML